MTRMLTFSSHFCLMPALIRNRPTKPGDSGAGGPTSWGEIDDFGKSPSIQAGQHGSEVAFDRHAEAAAGFHDRKDRGDFRSSLRAAHMQPVLASGGYGPHRVLRQVIGQLHFRVIETPPQLRPHI